MKTKLIFIILLIVNTTHAQEIPKIHLGVAIPLSDFGNVDLDNEDAGGAGIGANVGLQWILPLSRHGLGFYSGGDIMYNELASKAKDYHEDLLAQGVEITHNAYINMVLSAGLLYEFRIGDEVSLLTSLGVTGSYLVMTDLVLETDDEEVTITTKPGESYGFRVGGGFLISDYASIEFNYHRLGKYDTKRELKSSMGYSDKFDFEKKVDIFTVTLGFRL